MIVSPPLKTDRIASSDHRPELGLCRPVGPPSKTDRIASWWLDGALTAVVLLLCAFQLATWIPHLLTWPLFVDHDVFETMARGWDHGVLPYRESRGNNFPGTIYLFWLLGKGFGWGKTWPVLALDATFVVGFGLAILRWARLRSGRLLPGAVGFASFLSYYLAADYTLVFQRDWHGPLFLMLAFMVADGRRSRRGLVLSALCAAIAFAIRPQVVLLIPSVLACLARDDDGGMRPWRGAIGASIAWLALMGGFAALLFLPLVAKGLMPDFIEGVRLVAYGGSYNQATWLRALRVAGMQAMHLEFVIVPAAILALLPGTRPGLRGSAWAVLIALAGAWCYRPVSPVPWPYLSHPYHVVLAVAVAMLVQMILELEPASAAIRLVLVLFVLIGSGVTVRPKYCSVQLSLRALGDLRRGGPAEKMPIGYGPEDGPEPKIPYAWDDYRDALRYLREQTPPEAKVANLLRDAPALAGPADRASALPAESLAWLVVAPGEEANFLKAVEQGDRDTVVVWSPGEEQDAESLRLSPAVEHLAPLVRRYYEPRAKFGRIEVWTRRADVGPP
jgi:hypothetical protein